MNARGKKTVIFKILSRIIAYGLLMVLLYGLISRDAGQQGREMKFMEATFTEWSQQIILLLMTAIFAHCAYHFNQMRCLTTILAGISATGLVREHNNFFNEQVFDGAWQLLALTVLVATGILAWRYRNNFWTELNRYYESLSMGLLLAGFLITFIFSRLFGKTSFWQTLMEERYFRSVKNAAEECIELLGYGLLLAAAAEFYLLAKPKKISNT
jgi:hypothetical protein